MLITPRHPGRPAQGVTLVELLITLAVLAVSLSLAAPTFTQQIANYRVRSASASIIDGLNFARAEAARRNTPVTFTLDASGPGWKVGRGSTTLQSRAGGETPGVSATSGNGELALTFTSTGQVDLSAARLTSVTLTSAVPRTDGRRIDIFGGGLIRVCDPTATAADDPRRC